MIGLITSLAAWFPTGANLLLVATLFGVNPGVAPELPTAPVAIVIPDAPELVWKDETGQPLFDEGKAAFEAGDYKLAEEKFKAAGKKAKGKSTKNYVKLHREGARGMRGVQAQLSAGNKRKALSIAEAQIDAFRGTMVGAKFESVIADLSKEVYRVLENFEVKGGRYSEKFGKTWVTDPKFVKEGKQALKWVTTGQGPELKVKSIPRNLSDYDAIALWVCFPKKGPGYELIFKGKGTSKTAVSGDTIKNAFFASQSGHKGWKRIEVPLKRFKPQGDVKWTNISDFRIQFAGKRTITLYVDQIALIRKPKKSGS